MSKRTLALIITLLVITLFLLWIAYYQNNQNQTYSEAVPSITPKAVTPQTTLSLFPNPLSATGSSSSSAKVEIDTKDNFVTAVQLELSYDPRLLKNLDISLPQNNIAFFENPVVLYKEIDEKEGRISFALGISSASKPRKGMGTVAVITFRKDQSLGQTQITFLPKTLVKAEGLEASVLKESNGTTVASPLPPNTATPSGQ